MWPVGWSFGSDSFFLLLLPALQREEGEGIPSTKREVVLAKTEVPDDEWV